MSRSFALVRALGALLLVTSAAVAAQPGAAVAWGLFYSQPPQLATVPPGFQQFIAIAAGAEHVAGLAPDGRVVCWGSNTYGQTNVPADAANIIAIAAGNDYTLALRADGTVAAWGINDHGQTSPPPDLTGVTGIAAGHNHCLAVKSDGTVAVWGDGFALPGLSNVVAVAAGEDHSLALKRDGTIAAWGGFDADGQIDVPPGLSGVTAIAAGGAQSLALLESGAVIGWGARASDVPSNLAQVVAISAGWQHSAALRTDGTVVGWGNDSYGQTDIPAGLRQVTAVAAGYIDTLALSVPHAAAATAQMANGFVADVHIDDAGMGYTNPPTVQFQGGGGSGASGFANLANGMVVQIVITNPGTGYTSPPKLAISEPISLPAPSSPFLSIEPSRFHLTTHAYPGVRYQWFDSFDGQAWMPVNPPFVAQSSNVVLEADATTTGPFFQLRFARPSHAAGWLDFTRNLPFKTNLFQNPISVVSDDRSTVYGLLDDTTVLLADSAGAIFSEITNVAAIYSGSLAFAALQRDGTIVAANPPVPPGLNGIRGISLSGGGGVNLAVKQDGTVTAWGSGPATNIPPGLSNVASVSAINYFAVALKRDGTVAAWGDNTVGQTNVPPGLRGVIAIAGSENRHALALRSDGTVAAWGNNDHGQATVPPGLGNVKTIYARDSLSVALKKDGTVSAWGNIGVNAQAYVPAWATNIVSIAVATTVDAFFNIYSYILTLSENGSINSWAGGNVPPPFPPRLGYGTAIFAGLHTELAIVDDVSPSRPALAAPQVSNGFLVGLHLLAGGFGYTNPPAVQIVGGGGSGALAIAILTNGMVAGFSIASTGSGYTSVPEVIVDPPPGYIPPPPPVTIEPAQVAVHMSVTAGNTYQLLTSVNLQSWTPVGAPFVAPTNTISKEFEVANAGRFFKVQQLP